MGLFFSKKEGGLMDVIRCEKKDYVIWKWSPDGNGGSHKESSIRYGSSLQIKAGEVAVFVYNQPNGIMYDYIETPGTHSIKTANFPVLTSIVGAAFGGNSPFVAEVYFINVTGVMQLRFFIDQFQVADPRFMDKTAPVNIKGSITFRLANYKEFIQLNGLSSLDISELLILVKPSVIRCIKDITTNTPAKTATPLIQIERQIEYISVAAQAKLKEILAGTFGLAVQCIDITNIEIEKESQEYLELKEVTANIESNTAKAANKIQIQNMYDQQNIASQNMQETLRIQREEAQRLQKLQTESSYMAAHQLNIQGAVSMTAAESLGKLGENGGASMNGAGGFNPAGMMTGMMMGTAVGGGMTNMMNNAMQGINQAQPPTPPAGLIASFYIAVNGNQTGPYDINQLKQMADSGVLTLNSYVWKQGMGSWDIAGNVSELSGLFQATPPPLPPPFPPATSL